MRLIRGRKYKAMKNNELQTVSTGNLMETDAQNRYVSFTPTTKEDKIKLFNATANPDERLKDHINETITIKDFVVEMVELAKRNEKDEIVVDDDTGEVITNIAPRIIIIDKDGKTYAATSVGVFNALKRIVMSFGEPSTWDAPVKVKIKMVSRGTRNMMNFEMVK